MSTCSPNILLSKTRKHQCLDNFFHGKARTVHCISPELDSSFRSEASPDGAKDAYEAALNFYDTGQTFPKLLDDIANVKTEERDT